MSSIKIISLIVFTPQREASQAGAAPPKTKFIIKNVRQIAMERGQRSSATATFISVTAARVCSEAPLHLFSSL